MNIGSCAKGGLDTPIGRVLFEVYYVYEGDQERLITIAIAGVPVVGIGVALPPPPAPGEPADPGPAGSGVVDGTGSSH
jgi:hypothetical protein